MSTYAIGDVQGCFDELAALLARVRFDRSMDRLWFVGDLVNRGPKSLEVLRFVKSLGAKAVVVLGNHDLHLVCRHEGFTKPRRDDTLEEVLLAPDAAELVDWLRSRPMMHSLQAFAMVHAGLLPQWGLRQARGLAREVESALRGPRYRRFLEAMYGAKPDEWRESLRGFDRLRIIVSAMTRLRFCTPEGRIEFREKGAAPPPGHLAWFDARQTRATTTLVCGHWSTLGLKLAPGIACLDTGCVWGGALTAMRLEDRRIFQVPSPGYQSAGSD